MTLYHASQVKNLNRITPQRTLSNNEYIGDFVFAISNYKMALMYLVPKSIPILMEPNGKEPYVVICSNIESFIDKDKGGTIYELPSEDFEDTPQTALSDYEKVSKKPVTPVNSKSFDSVIKALSDAKINIKFTDKTTFNNLIKNPNQKDIIKQLKTYTPKQT